MKGGKVLKKIREHLLKGKYYTVFKWKEIVKKEWKALFIG